MHHSTRWWMLLGWGLFLGSGSGPAWAAEPPRLYPHLSLSRERIAFALAGDLWVVPRGGGTATRVTEGPEDDSHPCFSPDGTRIAFSRAVGANADVHVVAVDGGAPTRRTAHPAAELVRGWSSDGRDILFTAVRRMAGQPRLYTVPADGGPGRELPIPLAWNGVFLSADRVLYNAREVIGRYATSWHGYRGGSMAALAIADLRAGTFTPLSDDRGNDRLPVVAGGRVLVASDRDGGLYNVHELDPVRGARRPLTRFTDIGIGALAGGPDGAAVFERDGRLVLLDAKTGRTRPVRIVLETGPGETGKREVAAADFVDDARVGPGGEVAVVARGDLLLLDAAGKARPLTASSGAVEYSPDFSPDGRGLAYLSNGEAGDQVVLETLGRPGARRSIRLPRGRGGYFDLRGSPDGRHLAVSDLRGGLWLVDAEKGTTQRIDEATHMNDQTFAVEWSPDGRWLVYQKHLPNHNRALFLRNAGGGPTYALTSGSTDAGNPTFDREGKRILFVASGNAAVASAFGMYSELVGPLVLRRIQEVRVDLGQSPEILRRTLEATALARRIRTLPFEAMDYRSITVLSDSTLLAAARQWPATPGQGGATEALFRLDSRSPEPVLLASKVDRFAVSPDRTRLLVEAEDRWTVRPLPAGTGGTGFTLDGIRLTVDPREEWRQIHREAWQAMRETFYDPEHHGQDVAALERRHARYLPGITRRADLTALLYLGLGNVSVSHIAVGAGDDGPRPSPPPVGGLLGADFTVDAGRFRFGRIYAGAPDEIENVLAAPLDGIDPPVSTGDYLLRIDGVEVTADRDLDFHLLGTAGRPVTLTIAASADGRDARTITVRPLASDAALRAAAWVEGNRARVHARSNGTLGYVYVPDYQERGMAAFLRQWTAAADKEGVVIDQRFNPGGWAADFVLDLVSRRPLSYYHFRDARNLPFPVISNPGPRALIVNERNGSAAETFPWLFQRSGLGPVVGQRTAGAGVGHLYRYSFADRGALDLPLRAFFNPDGRWDIENHGVVPDIPVPVDPAGALRGEDAALDAAIDAVLERRRDHPTPAPRLPPPLVPARD